MFRIEKNSVGRNGKLLWEICNRVIERFRNWRCWLSNHRKLAESSLSEVAGENRFSDPSSSNATVESLTRADLFKMSPNIWKVGCNVQNEQEVETCFHVTRSRNCWTWTFFLYYRFFFFFFFFFSGNNWTNERVNYMEERINSSLNLNFFDLARVV